MSTHNTTQKLTVLSMCIKNSEHCFVMLEDHIRLAFGTLFTYVAGARSGAILSTSTDPAWRHLHKGQLPGAQEVSGAASPYTTRAAQC